MPAPAQPLIDPPAELAAPLQPTVFFTPGNVMRPMSGQVAATANALPQRVSTTAPAILPLDPQIFSTPQLIRDLNEALPLLPLRTSTADIPEDPTQGIGKVGEGLPPNTGLNTFRDPIEDVPEPSGLGIFGLAVGMVSWLRRRR